LPDALEKFAHAVRLDCETFVRAFGGDLSRGAGKSLGMTAANDG
jgi:hypothetical protein